MPRRPRKPRDIFFVVHETNELFVRADHSGIHPFLMVLEGLEMHLCGDTVPYLKVEDVIKYYEKEEAGGKASPKDILMLFHFRRAKLKVDNEHAERTAGEPLLDSS